MARESHNYCPLFARLWDNRLAAVKAPRGYGLETYRTMLAVGLARFSGARVAQDPGLIQAGTILTLIIPVALFVVFQRVFVRGIVITGVEK